jgi:hypothetical protein
MTSCPSEVVIYLHHLPWLFVMYRKKTPSFFWFLHRVTDRSSPLSAAAGRHTNSPLVGGPALLALAVALIGKQQHRRHSSSKRQVAAPAALIGKQLRRRPSLTSSSASGPHQQVAVPASSTSSSTSGPLCEASIRRCSCVPCLLCT